MEIFNNLPASVLQWFAIFISIIIEALPFVLLGTILSGFIEVYVTPDLVQRFLPRNRFLRILFGTFIGFVFPSCECGIVPIITRFLEKKVPSYTAVPSWQQLRLSTQSSFLPPIQLLEIAGAS